MAPPPQAMCNRAAACIIFGIALVLAMMLMGIQGGIYIVFGGPIPTRMAYWAGLLLFMTNLVSIVVTIAGCVYIAMGKHKLVVFIVIAVAMVIIVVLAAVVAVMVTSLEIKVADVQTYIGRNYKGDKNEPNFLKKMQTDMSCCGAKNYQDYKAKPEDMEEKDFSVPQSCCWSETKSTGNCNTGLNEGPLTDAGDGDKDKDKPPPAPTQAPGPSERGNAKGRKMAEPKRSYRGFDIFKAKSKKAEPKRSYRGFDIFKAKTPSDNKTEDPNSERNAKGRKKPDEPAGKTGTLLRAYDIWLLAYKKMKDIDPKVESSLPADDKKLKDQVGNGHDKFMEFLFGAGRSNKFSKEKILPEDDLLGKKPTLKIKVFGCGWYLEDFPKHKFISTKFGGSFQGLWLGTKILTVITLIAELAKTGVFIFYGIRFMREQGGGGLGGDPGASKKADGGASGRPGKKPGKEPNIANPWGF